MGTRRTPLTLEYFRNLLTLRTEDLPFILIISTRTIWTWMITIVITYMLLSYSMIHWDGIVTTINEMIWWCIISKHGTSTTYRLQLELLSLRLNSSTSLGSGVLADIRIHKIHRLQIRLGMWPLAFIRANIPWLKRHGCYHLFKLAKTSAWLNHVKCWLHDPDLNVDPISPLLQWAPVLSITALSQLSCVQREEYVISPASLLMANRQGSSLCLGSWSSVQLRNLDVRPNAWMPFSERV